MNKPFEEILYIDRVCANWCY